jgi:hypothetical protein
MSKENVEPIKIIDKIKEEYNSRFNISNIDEYRIFNDIPWDSHIVWSSNVSTKSLYGFNPYIIKYIHGNYNEHEEVNLLKFNLGDNYNYKEENEFINILSSIIGELSDNIIIAPMKHRACNRNRCISDVSNLYIFTQDEIEYEFPYLRGRKWLNNMTKLVIPYHKEGMEDIFYFKHKNIHCFRRIYSLYNDILADGYIKGYIANWNN